jgi:hypothetical protein
LKLIAKKLKIVAQQLKVAAKKAQNCNPVVENYG